MLWPKAVLPLCPLSYASINGTRGRIRTCDLPINSGNLRASGPPGPNSNLITGAVMLCTSEMLPMSTLAPQKVKRWSQLGSNLDNASAPARAG